MLGQATEFSVEVLTSAPSAGITMHRASRRCWKTQRLLGRAARRSPVPRMAVWVSVRSLQIELTSMRADLPASFRVKAMFNSAELELV